MSVKGKLAAWSVISMAVGAATQAHAASVTWDGGPASNGTAWNVAANWSGDVLPGANDTAQFTSTGLPANTVISLGSSQTIREFRINSFSGVNNFTIGSAADISAGNTLTLLNVYRGDNNGNTQTFAARIKLAGDSTWNIINGFNNSVAVTGNIVSDSAVVFTKEGSNSLTLNGANTFSGGVRALGGILSLGGSNTYTGSTVATGGNVTLNFNTGTAATTNIISSSSALSLGGSRGGGSLTASGKNAANAVNSQTFSSFSLGAGSNSLSIVNGIASGKTLIALQGDITRAIGSNLNFAQPTVNTTISAQNGYTSGAANDASDILGGYATVGGSDWATNNGTNIVAYTGYSTLSGASPTLTNSATANVNVTNGSTLDIGQASGTTTINTLRVSDAAARTVTVGTGNTLRLGAVGGILTPAGTGALTIGAAGTAGTLTAGGADGVAGELIFTNATAVTVNSVIANNDTSLVTLVKAGAGTLTLGATNTFTGGTFANAGTLQLGSGASLNSTGNIVVDGGTLNLGANTQALSGSATIAGGTISNGTLNKTGGSIDARNGTISATLTGTTGLTKTTPGSLSLSNTSANSFTGDTIIEEGSVSGAASNILSISGNLTVGSASGGNPASYSSSSNNATFNANKTLTVYSNGSVNGNNGSYTWGNGVNINIFGGSYTGGQNYGTGVFNMTGGTLGGGFFGGAKTINTSGDAMATISAGGSVGASFTVGDGASAIDALWSGSTSSGSITKSGLGVLSVTGNHTTTGIVTINAGAYRVINLQPAGTASNIGAGTSAAANLVINGGTLQYVGTGSTTDRNFTVGTSGATFDASGDGAVVFDNTAAPTLSGTNTARTVTLAGTSVANNTFKAALGNNGNGATALTKTDAGRWILAGNSGYTGATSVNGGTLLVSQGGSLGATAVTVSGASTVFGGGGTVGGNVTVSSGTLAPGDSGIGALTVGGNLTIAGTLAIELSGDNAGSSDQVLVQTAGTTLDITNAKVDFSTLVPLDDTAYVFAKYVTLEGTFAPENVTGLSDSQYIDYDYLGQKQIAVVVPEPAAMSCLVLGLGAALTRRRRIGR